jgi:F0F1-type ATP synthase epsilon subunit
MAVRQDASTGEMVDDSGQDTQATQEQLGATEMLIKVYSPYQVYFDDRAKSISAINDTGPFDILKGHRRFLTLLQPCELVIDSEKGEERIKISHGIMYVKEDRVVVFLDV